MSEDKMREVDATALETRIVAGELEAARMHGEGVAQSIQGLLEQLREYKKGATFWHTAYLELSDVKDAEIVKERQLCTEYIEQRNEAYKEIASRDLMIKELREILTKITGAHIRLLGIIDEHNIHNIPEDVIEVMLANEALAKSEHHNSRALEKMLLEARIDVLNTCSGRMVMCSDSDDSRAYKKGYNAKVAETNKLLGQLTAKLAELNKE